MAVTDKSATIVKLSAALVAAQRAFPAVAKTKTGKIMGQGKAGPYEYSYKYADLPDVKAGCDPILHAHGLAVAQFPGLDTLVTVLLHESGEWIEAEMGLHLAKVDPQGHGAALTYARRYAYCAVLGIVADEDDDAEQATRSSRAPNWEKDRETAGEERQRRNAQAKSPTDGYGTVVLATPAQVKAVQSALSALGIPDQSKRSYVAELLAIEPRSSKELTKREASALIELFKKEQGS